MPFPSDTLRHGLRVQVDTHAATRYLAGMQRLTVFQRVCVVIGFLLLAIATAGVLDGDMGQAAAVAFIGLCWLIASRLTYRRPTDREF